MITEKEVLRVLNKYHGEAYGHGIHSSAFNSVAKDILFAIRQNTTSNSEYKQCEHDFKWSTMSKYGTCKKCGYRMHG